MTKPKDSKDKQEPPKELSPKEYEQLGRMLQQVYETAYASKLRLMYLSFLQGVARGFGTIIGATLLIAAALAILEILTDVPLINIIFEPIYNAIEGGAEQRTT